jgi:hypothetical protein
MRSGMTLRFDYGMSTVPRVQFTLAIDPVSEPITGAIRDAQGHSVEFSGWLGFAVALEELLTAEPASNAAQRPPV